MNSAYVAASYVPSGGAKKEKALRQERWEQYQQQMQRPAMGITPEDPQTVSTIAPAARKRADSHSQPDPQHSQGVERQRRFSSASHYSTPQPAQSKSNPPREVRRISGNFNAPTYVEIERHNDTTKGARSKIKRLENTVKGWVRA